MSDAEKDSKLKKVGKGIARVGGKVGGKVEKALVKRAPGEDSRIGDDITTKGQKKKKGLQVHYKIKVKRATQVYGLNGKEVEVIYSNNRDRARNRFSSGKTVVKDGIATWDSSAPFYEFDVILKPWKQPVGEDEIPWRNYPVMFVLRTTRELTEEELKKLKEKLIKKQAENAEKEKKGITVDDEEDDDDDDDEGKTQNTKKLEELISKKQKNVTVATKVQLDLSSYAEDDLNITEVFGVPQKKKKKKKKKKDEADLSEEEEKEEPPVLAFKLIINIQAKIIKYLGRRISKDLTIEGERVMIAGEEWVILILFF